MKHISSRDNPQYKQLKLLCGPASAKKRGDLAAAEGIHLCQAMLEQGIQPQMCVLSDSALAHPEVQALLRAIDPAKVAMLQLADKLFADLSSLENGVGVLCLLPVPRPRLPERITDDAVVLDAVQDPGNLGSILRSAAAAGIRDVFCGAGSAQCWSPKVLRAGMGAHFVLRIHEQLDLTQLLAHAGIPVIATSSHVQETVFEADLRSPRIWLFGNEGQGVSSVLLQRANLRLALPHLGKIESLNVAACAAVCLFEQMRQRIMAQQR
ncbi:RNA methyltransferase [Massilia sp. W12]|uniref:TrmH family RNA methyltransferase n=1 Tax=Massilia sp. W12 TaxID=3126507 RepID=UPI0030D17C85